MPSGSSAGVGRRGVGRERLRRCPKSTSRTCKALIRADRRYLSELGARPPPAQLTPTRATDLAAHIDRLAIVVSLNCSTAGGCLLPSPSTPIAVTSTRSSPICSRRSGPPGRRARTILQPRSRPAAPPTAPRIRRFRHARSGRRRHVTIGQRNGAAEPARRHVNQHQVHGPPAEPAFPGGRFPARDHDLATAHAPDPQPRSCRRGSRSPRVLRCVHSLMRIAFT